MDCADPRVLTPRFGHTGRAMKNYRFLPNAALLGVAFVLVSFTGCQSVIEPSKTTTAFYKANVDAINGVSKAAGTIATAVAPDSPEVQKRVKELAAENAIIREDLARATDAADRKNQEIAEKLKDGLQTAAAESVRIAGALSGTGPLGDKLANFIAKDVTPALELGKKVQQNLDTAKTELAEKAERQKKDLEQAIKEFAVLNTKEQAAARAELVKLADAKGVKGAEGMSTEQLLAALATAGVSVAGLARTFGRSRSAEAVGELATAQDGHAAKLAETSTGVENLWDDVKALQAKIAVVDERTAGLPELRVKDIAHATTLDDHERRLDAIEAKG